MAINIKGIIEKAFEQAFSRALEQTLQAKAEDLFKSAFANGSPLAKKLETKIEEGFQRFVEEGIKWEKKKPGFKKWRVVQVHSTQITRPANPPRPSVSRSNSFNLGTSSAAMPRATRRSTFAKGGPMPGNRRRRAT
ncbi:MAG TPA: hypothetical protein VMV69_18930 [Pirellulales bacterium]|nr:hypothetical protein [Pirellulales bacterium]